MGNVICTTCVSYIKCTNKIDSYAFEISNVVWDLEKLNLNNGPNFQEGARRLNLDLLEHHKVVCLICAIQDHFYLRLSANVYNEVSDFVKLADALCELSRTKTIKVYTVTYKCKM